MAIFFAMPKLGMNMTEGRIVSWLAEEGQKVKAGEAILEIETDKATNEVEAPQSGILSKILHEEGEDVPCNSILAVILQEGEELPENIPTMIGEEVAPKAEVVVKPREAGGKSEGAVAKEKSKRRVRISPSARKLAEELGVDISTVTPSGSQIKREDVQRAYKAAGGTQALEFDANRKPFTGIRKRTADLMAESVHTTARVALNITADAEELIKARKNLEKTAGKVSYNVLIAKAAAESLKEYPYMNARLVDDEIWEIKPVNIGIAMNTERGLLVPVLKRADIKSVKDLQADFQVLADRAITGKSTPEDLEGGTFTITNLGAQEIESFVPVINLPECAILAVGAIMQKPAVEESELVVKNLMQMTLVFDHRLVDGAPAAEFLRNLKNRIENFEE